MPIYEYECEECHDIFEVNQRIADQPLSTCSLCSGSLKKLISMSSFHLKGGGWYADGYSDSKKKDDSKSTKSCSCPASTDSSKKTPAPAASPKAESASCSA